MIGNLLNRAMRLCGNVTIQWFAFVSRAGNSIGYDVTTYADPVPVAVSFQPLSQSMVTFLGLEATKEYANVYATLEMNGLGRDISGDRFVYNGFVYQFMSKTEWTPVAGWSGSVAVKLGIATNPISAVPV